MHYVVVDKIIQKNDTHDQIIYQIHCLLWLFDMNLAYLTSFLRSQVLNQYDQYL